MIDKAHEDAQLREERYIDERLRRIPRGASAEKRGYTGRLERLELDRAVLLHEVKPPLGALLDSNRVDP